MSELVPGELAFMLEFGTELQDRDLFGKQDPYCILKCGTLTRQSQICYKGGKEPKWFERFAFTLGTTEREITLQVFDKDKAKMDDVIGTGVVDLSFVRSNGKDTQVVPLVTHKGKQQGYVQVTMTFVKNQTLQDVTASYGTAAYKPPPSIYVGLHSTPSSTPASTPSLFSSIPASPFGGVPGSPYQPNPYGQPSPYAQPYPSLYGQPPQYAQSYPNPYGHPSQAGTQQGYYPSLNGGLQPNASYPPAGPGTRSLQANISAPTPANPGAISA